MGHRNVQKKVLLIRLSSLGDIVHCTAATQVLQQWDCEVYFATKPAFVPLIDACMPGVYSYAYEPHMEGGEKKARQKFFSWIEEKDFDHIVDLHDNIRTRMWRRALQKRAPLTVAHKPRLQEFCVLFLRMRTKASLGRGGRAFLYRQAALSAIRKMGVFREMENSSYSLTHLQVTMEAALSVQALLPKLDFVVFLPGSAWFGKRWSEKNFMELAKKISYPIVVLGSREEDFCDRIAQAGSVGSVSMRGKTSFVDCAFILHKARAIIGNDTGLTHMAEALGKDVIVLEGPTSKSLGFTAYRKGSVVLGEPLFCRPCSKNGRICWRLGTRACLRDLSQDKVYQALCAKLD